MQQVFSWYIMLGEGYFLTVYPEKETTDPMEVERQLRGLMACFKCVAADLCV